MKVSTFSITLDVVLSEAEHSYKSMLKQGNSQTLIHIFIHLIALQCIGCSRLTYNDIGLTVPW